MSEKEQHGIKSKFLLGNYMRRTSTSKRFLFFILDEIFCSQCWLSLIKEKWKVKVSEIPVLFMPTFFKTKPTGYHNVEFELEEKNLA